MESKGLGGREDFGAASIILRLDGRIPRCETFVWIDRKLRTRAAFDMGLFSSQNSWVVGSQEDTALLVYTP